MKKILEVTEYFLWHLRRYVRSKKAKKQPKSLYPLW